jgi:hypothetical protein
MMDRESGLSQTAISRIWSGAVAPGAFALQRYLAGAIALQSLVGDRGAGDIAAQAHELLALMWATAHRRM